jgi:hypothetical protein
VLLYFQQGIFGFDRFLDPFYARLSFKVYNRCRVTPGDEIDFLGQLMIDRGRFVFTKVGSVEIVRENGGQFTDTAELTRARFSGSIISGQPHKCLTCHHGQLIDDLGGDGRSRPRRVLYCTMGVADYRYCPYRSQLQSQTG